MMDSEKVNLYNQKIILKDNFYIDEHVPPNNIQLQQHYYHYPYLQTIKSKSKSNRLQKSFDKENLRKSNDLDFVKVNSLALAKKGSFKVSYLEDFTLDFPKNNYSSQQQSQHGGGQPKLSSPSPGGSINFISHIPRMHSNIKKQLNSSTSQRSSQNDIFYRMKTEGSYKTNELTQSSKEAMNVLLSQQTVQMNQPSSPASLSQWGLFSQSNNKLYNNYQAAQIMNQSKINSSQSNYSSRMTDQQNGEQESLLFKALISRKKGRSLPPLKLKQHGNNNTSQTSPQNQVENSPNNLQIQIQPFRHNNQKKYSYLFDTYNLVPAPDKVVQHVEAPILLEEDPEVDNVEQIFNGNKRKLAKKTSNQINDFNKSAENKKILQQLILKSPFKTPKSKKQSDLSTATTPHKDLYSTKQKQDMSMASNTNKFSDIQCIPFKSYKSPSKSKGIHLFQS